MPINLTRRPRLALGCALVFAALLTRPVSAQVPGQIPGFPPGVRPTPEQVRDILQSRPELVQQLRERLQASGLTPDQVHARLRAEGYPEDLLDPYLPGADTTRSFTPAPNTLDAVRSLGVVSTAGIDSLLRLDSTRVVSDSARRVVDSILAARVDSLRLDSLSDTLAARRGLKLFGYEVFRHYTTAFEPVQVGPVDENYRLGPGDVLVLIVTGDVERSETLEVTREGFVVISQVGQVYVANLTLKQLEDVLYTRLGRVYSGVRRGPNARTKFYVTVSRLRNIEVYVTGDVLRAGAYQISASGTVLTALYQAGGPTQAGSFRRIDVRRGPTLVDSVDIYDYLLRGINHSDVRLQSGDVIFVPPRGGLVKVTGRVLRPAIYEITPNETLRDAIAAAGGYEPNAIQGRVQIHRVLPPAARGPGGRDRVVIDVTDQQVASGVAPAFPLVPGDSITVFAAAAPLRDFVSVRGDVYVQGRVGYTEGMKLSEAIRLAGGPKPDVYLDRILISRIRSDSSKVQLRSGFTDSTGTIADDIVLEREDDIQVFSRAAFRTEPYVSVVGAVRRSGRVPYREGMTLRDLVLIAGGLTEDASLDHAEIARLPTARPTGALAQTVRVPLDSSYLFGRGGGAPGAPAAGRDPAAPPLEPYDNVLIPRQPGWALQRLVYVTGEVKYPGRYALTSKTERLADVIARAGGLTDEAYAGGVAFFRRADPSFPAPPRAPVEASERVQPLPPGFKERVGIDLPQVLKNADDRDNLILAAGDSIDVPEYDPIVTVAGAVNAPGPVAYAPGKNLDWYVDAAGGYAPTGDRDRVYVTQPDGKKGTVKRRFLLSDTQPKPGPGASIYVPAKAGGSKSGNAAAVLGVVASLIASLTTIVVVLRR
ncbi:MAG TPA: SLBB domain-containing protein [Gemmatimonadales bacterium]|nr:SLBB domain-containing protein [Gemmatimonadales bacterium]